MPSDSPPTAASSLVDFVNTVPAPIVSVLVGLSKPASTLRRALEVASWRAPWADSWLALAAWWAVCLLAGPSLRCVRCIYMRVDALARTAR